MHTSTCDSSPQNNCKSVLIARALLALIICSFSCCCRCCSCCCCVCVSVTCMETISSFTSRHCCPLLPIAVLGMRRCDIARDAMPWQPQHAMHDMACLAKSCHAMALPSVAIERRPLPSLAIHWRPMLRHCFPLPRIAAHCRHCIPYLADPNRQQRMLEKDTQQKIKEI